MRAALRIADVLAGCAGLFRLQRSRLRGALTILMYHRILPAGQGAGYMLPNLVVTRECFERQARWLADRCTIVTVREGVERLARGERPKRPMVALTFDDGYADNFGHAAPVLEGVGGRGTFFVTTGFVEGRPLWFDSAAWFFRRVTGAAGGVGEWVGSGTEVPGGIEGVRARLTTLDAWLGWLKGMTTGEREVLLRSLGADEAQPGCTAMSVEQVKELAGRGHEIGAHTLTHPVLTSLGLEEAGSEIRESVEKVRAWTMQSSIGFCYPNGAWSEGVRQACADVGVAYSVGTRRHANRPGQDRLTLGRRWIAPESTAVGGRHSGSLFAGEVLGFHDWVRDRLGRSRGPGRVGQSDGGKRPPAPPLEPRPEAPRASAERVA